MKTSHPLARRLAGWLGALLLAAASAGPAGARGIGTLNTEYPVALSVQIDPATITDDDLREIRASGFELVRFGVRPPLKSVNPTLIDYPKLIQRVRKARLDAIVTLFGGKEIWGHEPGDLRDGGSRESLFADFASDFIKAHSADVAVWEIWNEPDHKTFLRPDLVPEFGAASSALCSRLAQRQIRPDIIVGFGFAKLPFVGGSNGKVPPELEDAFVSAARSDCLTDISIHPYRSVPETALADYEKLRVQLDRRQLNKTGIVASEWGYASYMPVRNQGAQASLIFREYLINAAAGIRLLNLYSWRDRGDSYFSKEDNFGLKSKTGEKKEAYSALTEFLKIARHSQKVSYQDAGGASRLVLRRGQSLLHVVWTQGGEKTVSVPANGAKKCTRVDFFPRMREGSCGSRSGDGFTVGASSSPVLLSISD
ncbi:MULTISPECIES: hypothetical protein [unclassified Variovorax]|jgi:hypothetical protein|uniref:hypothetical protein n=1 Tax=unclassified Variovorax TaxID=663243 RepID=UPI000F7E5AE5|nr:MULTISPECIES: hypothetical protein [unclassified Variovorax]RSZ42304.1 hypothetical protein EJO70_10735 [Variovorax sp. 553]RSZ43279.1 hypothetical protein EJO71_10725 [Variovorax sp. 679]